jgi:hypothetical protein
MLIGEFIQSFAAYHMREQGALSIVGRISSIIVVKNRTVIGFGRGLIFWCMLNFLQADHGMRMFASSLQPEVLE